MTKEEAILAMKHGEKVTHVSFKPEEYIYVDKFGIMRDELGYNMTDFWRYRTELRWNDEWDIYISENVTP